MVLVSECSGITDQVRSLQSRNTKRMRTEKGHGCSRLATEQQPARNRCGRVQRSVDILESRRNEPQPSTRREYDWGPTRLSEDISRKDDLRTIVTRAHKTRPCSLSSEQCTSPTASIARLMSARSGVCVPARQRRQRRWLFQWLVAARSGIALPGRRCPRVEQFTVVCHIVVVTVYFQTTFEDVYLFVTSHWWRWPSFFFLCLPNTWSFLCMLRVFAVFTARQHSLLCRALY